MLTGAITSATRSLFVTEYYLTLELSTIFSLQASTECFMHWHS